jgi:pyruvate,water dikinase
MPTFEPPGPGSWELERAHFSRAATSFTGEILASGLTRGVTIGCEQYGLPLKCLRAAMVNNFFYAQQVPILGDGTGDVPAKWLFMIMTRVHPEMRRRVASAKRALEQKLWRRDLELWDAMKIDSIERNSTLYGVDMKALSDVEMDTHLRACAVNAEDMVYRHHRFTIASIFPMGIYLHVATVLGGLSVQQALSYLRGSTPISLGTAQEELQELARALKDHGVSADEVSGIEPLQLVDTLEERHVDIVSALTAYTNIVGAMLVGGYCISEKTLIESPILLRARIADAMGEQRAPVDSAAALEQGLAAVDPTVRGDFEAWFNEVVFVNRMRDERGVYNDMWGSGIARLAFLEVGDRLVTRGVLPDRELAVDSAVEELLGLLAGNAAAISVDELVARRDWRLTQSIDEIPQSLGPEPAPPPPIEWLPKSYRLSVSAMPMVFGNLNDDPDQIVPQDSIRGVSASGGVYEGTARVVKDTSEFGRLQQGDVLVTRNTSAAFNVVLPLIGAVVTDRGGALSHAAIVAREYGIPGVVSARVATERIADGSRVRVDGDTGEVTVLG